MALPLKNTPSPGQTLVNRLWLGLWLAVLVAGSPFYQTLAQNQSEQTVETESSTSAIPPAMTGSEFSQTIRNGHT